MLAILKNQEKSTVLRSLPSKFRPPATAAHLVTRLHIIERIQQAAEAKLLLVQAPAGFGKTTLLRHLYDLSCAQDKAVAWLTLDAGDNDLDQFMACLNQMFEQMNDRCPLHERSPSGEAADHALGFIEAIAATNLPFLLILDEFEHIHNPAALSVLQQIIEVLGPQQQIIIGSREHPPLSLGRLRTRQQLLEINASQLRFSLEEASEFLRNKRHLKLDDQDIEKLQQVTDGWVAALWLSSLALEGNTDPKRVVQTFSGSNTAIASYLAEDVLAHKPQHLQDFILQISILQQFCAESCNAVTGRDDSRQLLQEIERSNLFITPLDEQHIWYSFHPLFSKFLRLQLERQHAGFAATLHRRAALWYLEQKRPTRAIDHAIASGNQYLLVELLKQNAESLLLQGRVRLLARWFDALDRACLVANAKLVYVYVWVLIHTNRSAEALILLESITHGDAGSPISHRTYLMLKTFGLVMLDRIEETAPMWEDPHILNEATQEPLLRNMLLIGCAYYNAMVGRYQEARQMLDQATQERTAVGQLFGVVVAGYIHSMLDLLQGRLRASCARLRAIVGEPTAHQPAAGARLGALSGLKSEPQKLRHGSDSGFASVYLAEVLYEMDQLDEAKHLLKMYLPLVKEAGLPDQIIISHLIYARILRAENNPNDALQTLLDMEQLGLERGLTRIVDSARLERARSATLDDNLETAKLLLEQVGCAAPRRDLHMVANDTETPQLGLWRWQIHSGQASATLPPLKEHLKDAQRRGRLRYALRVKVLYAMALSHSGQRNPALRTLREALQEAQAEGFVRAFKDEGPALLALLREMLDGMREATCPEHAGLMQFAEAIVSASHAADQPASNAEHPAQTAENELTGRELDVLRLLAKGNCNQAIAEKLFVSVTTVRTHLRNINLKLNAHNRTEAIAIARNMAIIA